MSEIRQPVADEVGIADSNGVRIGWRRYGDGPRSILFIPTWNFVDSRVLRHQVEGLRDRFRLLTFDARGSGSSGHPKDGYRFEDHVADAMAVLDDSQTPSASLVAGSLGTHVAVLLAARHPDRVARLVLIAPPMSVGGADEGVADAPTESSDEDASAQSSAPDWRTDYPAFVPWFIGEVFSEPDSQATIDEVVSIALEADHAMLLRQAAELDWDEAPRHLKDVRCPTLIIHGAADRTLELASIKAVAAGIPGARLVLLESLGHRPDIRRPDIVNPILARFLGDDEA
ncbi:MAG: alpha/beta hydrolase [Candidatus Limnocylindria bacterium]